MKFSKAYIFLLLLLAASFTACNPLKFLRANESLVNRNVLISDRKAFNEQLEPLIKQKPNRRLAYIFRFHLAVYNLANSGKETKFKNWFKKTIGEEPVIYDSTLAKRSAQQMQQHLVNKGYFDATVRDSAVRKRNKMVVVYYLIKTKQPYLVDTVYYQSQDSSVLKIVLADSSQSLIKHGKNFDSEKLQQERERITKHLKNLGYYQFSKEYIYYEPDSGLNNHKVNLYLYINRVNEFDSTTQAQNHKVFVINKVFIQPDFNPRQNDIIPSDTTLHNGYYFTSSQKRQVYKPKVVIQSIFIKKADTFSDEEVSASYQRLSDMLIYRFVNIKFKENTVDTPHTVNKLDCMIQLTPLPIKSFSIETEGTNNGGNLGLGGNINIRNKNIFGGAELLELRLKGGLEAQKSFVKSDNNQSKTLFLFNTIEIGPEISLTFPKFLLPFNLFNGSQFANPKTTITAAYNYQVRPDFRRVITNLSFNYKWRQSLTKSHIIALFEVSGINVDRDSILLNRLKTINDPLVLNSYHSHLTTDSRYTFIYNNQSPEKRRNFTFFTGSLEFSGNILRGISTASKSQNKIDDSYTILGLRYSQYVKSEVDLRFYRYLSDKNSLVYRITGGLGVPYLNSQVMPFEKAFVGGGSNDNRAWQLRRLGPGSYYQPNIDQIGDIKIAGNVEFRFDMFKFSQGITLQGAWFVDAGNIWAFRKDDNRDGADFEWKRFYKEFAVGSGLGARFNFNFFIIRLDYGIKLRDPGLEEAKRWYIGDVIAFRGNLNFGIGYPF